MEIEHLFLQSDKLGIRLEIMGNLPVWEPQPVYRHQKHARRISESIRPLNNTSSKSCGCIWIQDVYIKFPNGLKRPDISILCHEPPEEEQDHAITIIPEAVVEIISKGFERKDLKEGPAFYLANGVKDIIVFDPFTKKTYHFRPDFEAQYETPVTISLECGCKVDL
ncbi:conserved hypothetical protein [Desulfamplus magnetovallimortis]|uniref:Putative restriction endonuclease domain-containing protein n=1 Tax=Desulfamplus magnetovallimortis TaxID=1246637 RepID=A0A1W1HHU6_9BACT|nr:Uma2 family endonuclease [Desulfamplus magnetovallimortis]SLM32054.1 conserved hypothetical protein [Desulfamplus magnetovallimortis]